MLILQLAAALLAADTVGTYAGTAGETRVPLPRIDAAVVVDGMLDEPVWAAAARLTEFSQYHPVDGRAAELRTEILVWYSPTALHFGVRAHARPGSVRATQANRDRLAEEDRVEFYLGTYNDGHQALVFGVNPLGVQQDGTMAERGGSQGGGGGQSAGREGTDLSPDFVYASRGRLTDYGYEVEIRIPFKTLRYQSVDPQDWRLHVTRWVQALGQEHSWVPARRAGTSFLGQSGTLQGLTQLRRGLVMDLNPVVTARALGGPSPSTPGAWNYDEAAEFGANVRWGLTPNLTLNGTYNPDFSQVESDASQIVTDPRRALFFPEKRPFFLEGIEQFSTPNRLVYSRQIAAPVAATKLTGKVSGTDVATMFALDGKEVSRTGGDHPVFAIARVQRDLGGGSRAGAVFTSRTEPGLSNQVAGVDSRLVLGGDMAVTAQIAGSFTTRDGDARSSPLWQFDVRHTGRRLGFSATFSGVGDEFEAGAGFVSEPDIVSLGGGPSWTVYGAPGALIARATTSVRGNLRWIYRDFVEGRGLLDRQFFLSGNVQFRDGWGLNYFSWFERFGYDHRIYRDYALERHLPGGVVDTLTPYPGGPAVDNIGLSFTLSTPWVGPFSGNINSYYGNDVDYDEWSPARIWFINSSIQFRPTSQLRAEGTYILTSYRRRSDGTLVSVGHIPRVRVEYQVTPSVFVRVVGEYRSSHRDDLRDDGRTDDPILIRDPVDGIYKRGLALARQSNGLRGDFLFSYQPVPGTVFFAGYGGNFLDTGRFKFSGLERRSDGFFLKASYLFRM